MSKVFILSTMTNSVMYATYRMVGEVNAAQKTGPMPVREKDSITIRGGADRPSQKLGFGQTSEDVNGNILWTAKGVVTPITEEQYARLKDNWLFKKHVEGGYLAVVAGDVANDHRKVSRKVEEIREKAQDTSGDETAGQDRAKLLTKENIAQRINVRVPTKELSQEWN